MLTSPTSTKRETDNTRVQRTVRKKSMCVGGKGVMVGILLKLQSSVYVLVKFFFLTLLEKIIVYNCSVMLKIFGQRLKSLTIRFINVLKVETMEIKLI